MKNKPEKIYHISDRNSLGVAIRSISKIVPSKDKVYRVRVTLDDEDRSIKQNRLSFLLYKELGLATGNGAIQERCRCKLQYGLNILLEDTEFYKFYNNTMLILPYEDKLKCMEYINVTSFFSMKQFASYLNTIYQESAAQGIVLSQPKDLYYEALMKQEDSRR